MPSHREIVGRGLDALAEPLNALIASLVLASPKDASWVRLVEERDAVRFGKAMHYSADDPRFLLRFVTENRSLFQDALGPLGLAYASEVRTIGNSWAHNAPFTEADAARATDTMALLARAAGSPAVSDSLRAATAYTNTSVGAEAQPGETQTAPTPGAKTGSGPTAENAAPPDSTRTTILEGTAGSRGGTAVHILKLETDSMRVEL